MHTSTFTFIEETNIHAHASVSVVTAETKDECVEKYYLKYPDRLFQKVEITDGDNFHGFGLRPKENN